MDLQSYLSQSGLTEAEFAEKIDRDQSYVNRLKRGAVWPSRETCAAIFEATGGAVSADDFLALAPALPAPAREAAQ